MSWHSVIPWDWWRQEYLRMIGRYFSRDPPDGTYLRVDLSQREVDRSLGEIFYAPQETLSYDKEEDLNLARQYYDSRGTYAPVASLGRLIFHLSGGRYGMIIEKEVVWWQNHIRGYVLEDGLYLTAHDEPSARHEDSAHIEGIGHSREKGLDQLRIDLDGLDIEYEVTEGKPV